MEALGGSGAKAFFEDRVGAPVVVGEGRCDPDDDAALGVDVAGCEHAVVGLVVDGAGVEGAGFHELGGGVVAAGVVVRGAKELGGALARVEADEVLGNEASGGGGLGSECEAVAAERLGEGLGACQAEVGVGDEVGAELAIDAALRDGAGATDGGAGLGAGQTAEPGELDVGVLERLDGTLIVGGRDVLDGKIECLGEVGGEGAEALLEAGVGVVRDCREAQDRGVGSGGLAAGGSVEEGCGDQEGAAVHEVSDRAQAPGANWVGWRGSRQAVDEEDK